MPIRGAGIGPSSQRARRSSPRIVDEVAAIANDLVAAAADAEAQIEEISPEYRASAINLRQYLAMRQHDIRHLQDRLSQLGLSSLGRSEAHVFASVRAALANLQRQEEDPAAGLPHPAVEFRDGERLLERHTDALLGPRTRARRVRIMVTSPPEAAEDAVLVRSMLESGMDCLRINCAHDSPDAWARMIANLRWAEAKTGLRCRLMMDLAGPKLRTGPVEPGPPVVKWRPMRDAYGRVVTPARVLLVADDEPAEAPVRADLALVLPRGWLEELRVGDDIRFVDAREANRSFRVVEAAGSTRLLEGRQTAYVTNGTRLVRIASDARVEAATCVAGVPRPAGWIPLKSGDTLIVTRDLALGQPASEHEPARIGCTLPEVFVAAKPGERIWFDDGTIGGVIQDVRPDQLTIAITDARPSGSRLRAEKGINLPDTELRVSALTSKDLDDLTFVAQHADLVGLSFVRDPTDVLALQREISALGDRRPGIVLKIETRRAFAALPELILAAMRSPGAGIMIARGDLAVELGYERLAEVQEEILWIAEAAHLPVIWATQVLETLARTGVASRSEITDAAMGERAECVMLNKGPHIVEAITLLDGILRRMQTHQRKKRALFRRLRAWTPEP